VSTPDVASRSVVAVIQPRARIASSDDDEEASMSKRARKRRDRGKKAANHGKKPNT
jgi:hypothetical protein